MSTREHLTRLIPQPAPDDTHDWREQSLCRQVDPELFFGEPGANPNAARRVCAACPVTAECLTAGINEQWGIWGGTTYYERRQMRKQRQGSAA